MANIKITNYKIKSKVNKTIVLISDIHYYSRKDLNKLENIYNKINELKPNYICIAGDFIDEANILDEDLFVFFLKKLAKICKVVITLGNHDITVKDKDKGYVYNDKLFTKIRSIRNLYLLDNETKVIDDICFIGLNLGFKYYYDNDNGENSKDFLEAYHLLKKINNKKYNVLLCHSPLVITEDNVIKALKDINLVLCGHTHGGLTPNFLQRYLKNRIFISPDKKKFFVNNGYGYLPLNNLDIIISSGITKLSHASKISNLDFLFKPEIVVIDLINK